MGNTQDHIHNYSPAAEYTQANFWGH